MPRKSPSMAEKLASALLELQRLRGDPIDRDHAKAMSAAQVNSLFHFDHAAGYACDGADNHPTGLTPLLIAEHREKTATRDVPAIAKGKRLSAAHAKFRERMLAKTGIAEADAETVATEKVTKIKVAMKRFIKEAESNGGWGKKPSANSENWFLNKRKKLLAQLDESVDSKKTSRIKSRGFEKGKSRPIQSMGFAKRIRRNDTKFY
jgi:hypothetical protein